MVMIMRQIMYTSHKLTQNGSYNKIYSYASQYESSSKN